MHHGDWDGGWGLGAGWYLPMALMMVVLWGGLIWVAVTLIRRGDHAVHPPAAAAPGASAPPVAPRQTPQEILAERLARGEIEPDDYRQRIDALQHRVADL